MNINDISFNYDCLMTLVETDEKKTEVLFQARKLAEKINVYMEENERFMNKFNQDLFDNLLTNVHYHLFYFLLAKHYYIKKRPDICLCFMMISNCFLETNLLKNIIEKLNEKYELSNINNSKLNTIYKYLNTFNLNFDFTNDKLRDLAKIYNFFSKHECTNLKESVEIVLKVIRDLHYE